MATKTDRSYREAARRAHRLLGAYLVQCAWARGVDCFVIEREPLFRHLGLEARIEGARLDWLTAACTWDDAGTKLPCPCRRRALCVEAAGERAGGKGFAGVRERPSTRLNTAVRRDLRAAFPHFAPMSGKRAGRPFTGLHLSRKRWPDGFPWGRMNLADRLDRLSAAGIAAAVIDIPDELEIVRRLAFFVQGLRDNQAFGA